MRVYFRGASPKPRAKDASSHRHGDYARYSSHGVDATVSKGHVKGKLYYVPELPRPTPDLQLSGDGEDGVCIDGAVVVGEDDAVLTIQVQPRAPAVSAQVAGDAVERVRFGEEVDPAVLVGVHAVGEDIGGHELAQADRPVDRPPDFERIEAV